MIGPKTDNSVAGSTGVTQAGRDVHGIPPETHREMMQTALADLRKDLEDKHAEARRADSAELKMLQMQIDVLNSKISEQERRLADPEQSYQDYLSRIAELEQLLENATVEIGENRIKDATAAMEAGDNSLADQIFAEVEEHEAKAVARAAEAAFGRGLIAEEAIRWADAARHYARAARLLPEYRTYRKASEFGRLSGDFAAALRIGAQCLAHVQRGDDEETLASALNSQAIYLYQAGRYGEAEPLFRQALEIGEKTLGVDHPDYGARLNNFAGLLLDTGRFDEAEPLFRQALGIREKRLGVDHPDYAQSLNNLAALLRATGRYGEAEPLYRQALEIDEKALGVDHPEYAIRLNNLAVLFANMKRYPEAVDLMKQALQICMNALGPEHPYTIGSQNNLETIRKAME